MKCMLAGPQKITREQRWFEASLDGLPKVTKCCHSQQLPGTVGDDVVPRPHMLMQTLHPQRSKQPRQHR